MLWGVVCGSCVSLIQNRACLAEPPPIALEESQDPILVEAQSIGLRYAPPGVADQEKSVELFLRFIESHPDSELVPLVYMEVASSYTSLVTPEQKKFGAREDKRRALIYRRRAMAAYPEGKVGPTLSAAWVSAAALTPGRSASALAYLDYLQWLHSLTLEGIAKHLWLSKEQQALVDSGKVSMDSLAEGFMRQVKQMQGIATINMLSIIDDMADDSERIALLEQIAARLADTDAGWRAVASMPVKQSAGQWLSIQQREWLLDVHVNKDVPAKNAFLKVFSNALEMRDNYRFIMFPALLLSELSAYVPSGADANGLATRPNPGIRWRYFVTQKFRDADPVLLACSMIWNSDQSYRIRIEWLEPHNGSPSFPLYPLWLWVQVEDGEFTIKSEYKQFEEHQALSPRREERYEEVVEPQFALRQLVAYAQLIAAVQTDVAAKFDLNSPGITLYESPEGARVAIHDGGVQDDGEMLRFEREESVVLGLRVYQNGKDNGGRESAVRLRNELTRVVFDGPVSTYHPHTVSVQNERGAVLRQIVFTYDHDGAWDAIETRPATKPDLSESVITAYLDILSRYWTTDKGLAEDTEPRKMLLEMQKVIAAGGQDDVGMFRTVSCAAYLAFLVNDKQAFPQLLDQLDILVERISTAEMWDSILRAYMASNRRISRPELAGIIEVHWVANLKKIKWTPRRAEKYVSRLEDQGLVDAVKQFQRDVYLP